MADFASVDWSSVLIPALVAAVVALAVEWIAKPTLEARKERILELDRGRRASASLGREALMITVSLNGLAELDPDPEKEESLTHERAKLRARLKQVSDDFYTAIAAIHDELEGVVCAHVAGRLRAAAWMDDKPTNSIVELLAEPLSIVVSLLDQPRRSLRHRRAVHDAKRWLEQQARE